MIEIKRMNTYLEGKFTVSVVREELERVHNTVNISTIVVVKGVYSFPLPSKCKVKGVNARIADKLVWNGLVDFMSSPDLIKQQIQRWQKKRQLKSDTSFDNVDQLQREIEKIKKEESRYIKAYGAEVITLEQFQETMTELRGKREVLENQIGHLNLKSLTM